MEGLQLSIASLAGRLLALSGRFAASNFSVQHSAGVCSRAFSETGREVSFNARQLSLQVEKAWESAAEEARVRAEQLEACAVVLEREAEEGELDLPVSVAAAARALLSCPHWDATCIVVVDWDSAALHAGSEASRIRDGVNPALCREWRRPHVVH